MKIHSNDGKKAVIQYTAEELNVIKKVLNITGEMDPYIRDVSMERVQILQGKLAQASADDHVILTGRENNELYALMIAAATEQSIVKKLGMQDKTLAVLDIVKSLHLSFLDMNPGSSLE